MKSYEMLEQLLRNEDATLTIKVSRNHDQVHLVVEDATGEILNLYQRSLEEAMVEAERQALDWILDVAPDEEEDEDWDDEYDA